MLAIPSLPWDVLSTNFFHGFKRLKNDWTRDSEERKDAGHEIKFNKITVQWCWGLGLRIKVEGHIIYSLKILVDILKYNRSRKGSKINPQIAIIPFQQLLYFANFIVPISHSIFKTKFIYFLIFWLHWVFITVSGSSSIAESRDYFPAAVHKLLIVIVYLGAELGL